MEPKILLRPASIEDAELLLVWRNDPETRDASHNSERIEMSSHISWLTNTLKNPSRKLYIAEKASVPIGCVRADLSGDTWELSWTVAPTARGLGFACTMVKSVAQKIPEAIRAEVKVGNIASARVAERVGMHLEKECDGIIHYKRDAII